jgi:hypothetical protein
MKLYFMRIAVAAGLVTLEKFRKRGLTVRP